MKPFKKKYVVYKRNNNFEPIVAFYTKDRKGNYLPLFFDQPAQAVLAIAARMSSIAQAALGNEKIDLNDAFGYFIANVEHRKVGEMVIYIAHSEQDSDNQDENIYEGHYNGLVKETLDAKDIYHLFPR